MLFISIVISSPTSEKHKSLQGAPCAPERAFKLLTHGTHSAPYDDSLNESETSNKIFN